MAVVLKPFPFAGDGFTLENLVPGVEREFGGCTAGLVEAGLVAEGAVAAVEPEPEPESVELEPAPPIDEAPPVEDETPARKRK